jgi:Leucine-rich repeat (LRR) protein
MNLCSCSLHIVVSFKPLSAADNNLQELLDIPEPRPLNLRTADFRRNRISQLTAVQAPLAAFESLSSLSLDGNSLLCAAGLAPLQGLRHLSITDNGLKSCNGLGELTVHSHSQPNCSF